jgi:ATP-dependent exoDNAse (exonuclease V) beta subunit
VSSAVAALPVDAAARARVRDDHGVSLLIEAGAGTGKTTALVDRVVALVAAGDARLREIAAITFTEAAAAELRDRIRARLELAAEGAVDWIADGAPRAQCRDALAEIDDAALTTLHGFAQRLLSEHPLEAGLPPVFEVLDEIRARVRFDQRWAELVDRLFAHEALEEVLLTGLILGFRFDHLRDAARLLHDNHDRVRPAPPVEPLPALDVAPLVQALDDVVALRHECRDDDDGLAVHIDVSIRPLRDLLVGARDRLDVLEVLARAPKLTCGKGQKGNWSVPKADVVTACELAQARCAALVDGQRTAVLSALVHHVVEFVRADARTRAAEGTLEFHDLLVLARDLLRSHTEVREAAAHRWRRLFLDEFQDTDPLQIELAVLLASSVTDAGARDWRDVPIAAGALAVVGDPQQSIYRFRRADLRVYDDVRRSLDLDDARLVENFRSVPDIIDAINAVFATLFADPEHGVQATHVQLHAHRAPLTDWPASVSVFGEAVDDRVAVIREQEARDVASVLQAMKRDAWPVVAPDGSTRPVSLSDVAILIPSRTVLPGIEDALEQAGIPARVESQSLVFATAEIRDLVSILSAIDDPTDSISVVAALRSPAFGCTDAELARYALAGGRWDYRVVARGTPGTVPDDDPVVVGLRALHGFWDQRWWRSVSEIVEAVVRERSLLELATARRRPRDHWRRTRWFLDQARAWDDAGGSTLRGFVEWAREQAEERARVTESIAPEPDDDAVRILTVHGAKGLEFPVVLLAGLSTQPPVFNPPVVWDASGDAEYRVGTKAARAETPGYADALAAEGRHDTAERLRLLYVAMTRARDHLVVSLHRKAGAKCHAASVAEALDATGPRRLEPDAPEPASPRARGATPPDEPAAYERWEAERETALAHAARPLSIAATTIAALEDGGPVPEDDPGLVKEPPDEPAPRWRRGRAGTAIGRAVHAVLQTIDLRTGDDLAVTARAQAFAEGVANRADEVERLAEAAIRAPVVRAAVAGDRRWWREVPVATEIDGIVLEGFVDLLVDSPDGLVVVDYKTDHVSDAELDTVLEHYAVQGAAYAVALEAALARPVVRCVFVFARSGGPLEREVADLDAAKAEVLRRLARRARG